MQKTVQEELNQNVNWLCREYPDLTYSEVLNRCKEMHEQERHVMEETPYLYVVAAWDNGNKTHCRDYFSKLATPIRISIAYQLGKENRDEIIKFINN